jgi:VCBS repeat protein
MRAEEMVMAIYQQWKRLYDTAPFLLAIFLLAPPTLLGMGSNLPLFRPVATYDPGGQSFSVAVADVNGDGNPDLLVGNAGVAEGSIGILLGRGDGTFQPVATYDSGGSLAYSIAVADVNGDGNPDLVVANCGPIGVNACQSGNGLIGVLLGNGDGTFQPVVTYSSGGNTAVSVAVADLNGDGRPDLLVANECDTSSTCAHGSVGVLLSNGDGTFQAATVFDVGNAIDSIAVADVNGDAHQDVLAGGGGENNNVDVLLGNGDGTFQPLVTYNSGGNTALSVAVADVNGDGKPDLVVGNQCDTSINCAHGLVGVLLGNGDGTFQLAVGYDAGGTGAWSVAVADVNGDRKPDLMIALAFSNVVAVLVGNGDGTFQAATTYGSGGTMPRSVAVADVNRDGKPDVAVSNFCSDSPNCLPGKVGVLLNNTGSDSTPPTITLSATAKAFRSQKKKVVQIKISGTITDTGSGVNISSVTFAVRDEHEEVRKTGTIVLGTGGKYSLIILLGASRRGPDPDGRRYTVTVRAEDNAGNRASQKRVVIVPHNDRGEDDENESR